MRIGKIVAACLLVLGVMACSGDGEQKSRRNTGAVRDDIARGKYFLTKFDGQRARDNFHRVTKSSWYADGNAKDSLYCQAMYGVILADAQRFVTQVNSLLGLVLKMALSPAPAMPPGSFQTAANISLSNAFDFGELLDPAWRRSLEPILTEMANYADEVTRYEASVADCGFDIGVALEERSKNYLYVINLGDDRRPFLQIQFKGRLDGAEARVINSFARTILAGVDFLLAHDLSTTIDLGKLGHILGLPIDCLPNDGLACLDGGLNIALQDLPGIAFLFEDNPNLLGKKDSRWYRMERISKNMERAFLGMRTFFPSLLVRDSRAEAFGGDVDERLSEYLISYRDRNSNGQVDGADTFGVNIEGLKCDPTHIIESTRMSATDAASLRSLCGTVETVVESLLLSMLRDLRGMVSQSVVEELTEFNERAYANMHAVENPGYPYQRIPISAFNNTLKNFPLELVTEPMLPWLELDLAEFLIEPRALRSYLPYWEKTTSYTGARFLIDSDDYSALDSVTGGTVTADLGTLMFSAIPPARYQNHTLSRERPLFQGVYNGGSSFGTISGLQMPADCLNISSLVRGEDNDGEGFPVFSLAWQDPTFNGLMYINLGEWAGRYSFLQTYTNPDATVVSCVDPPGALEATNYSLNKGMWIFVKHFLDTFTILDLLDSF